MNVIISLLFSSVTIIFCCSGAEDDTDSIVFVRGNFDFIPNGYEEVSTKPPESLGALEKCGEGSDAGVHMCVTYFKCDGATNKIVQEARTDGFGLIDIRFGANKCQHPLDVCCGIPDGDVPPPSPDPKPDPSPESPRGKVNFCGIRNTNGIDFKITGNKDNEAEYGEFPWMVAILKNHYDSHRDKTLAICGGSLITPKVVLTGAHCVDRYNTQEIKVRAGEWDTQTDKERLPYQERDVEKIIIHEKFHPQALFNDVALIVLKSPFDEADNIGTVCLPEQGQYIESNNCFASGWGKDKFGKEAQYQVILKKIELPIVQNALCENILRTTRLGKDFKLDKSFICAGGRMGKDTCTGDGGSPLVCPDAKNPNRYIQTGIVAWGIGCGEEHIPGVYADVSKFRSWVDSNLRRLNFDSTPYLV